jgi:hypothetical protein
MKHLFIKSVVLYLAVFSTSAFAEKLVIKGEPLVLEQKDGTFIVPDTYKVQNFQYVIINGKKRACFVDKQPDLVNLDVISINVLIGQEKATWNCYSPDPVFFVIQQE